MSVAHAQAAQAKQRMPRPRGVTLIALVMLASALVKLVSAVVELLLLLSFITSNAALNDLLFLIGSMVNTSLLGIEVLLVFGIFELISTIGILSMRPWAWLMAMISQGAVLANELARYPLDGKLPTGMLAAIVIVFYLNQHHIRRAFVVAQHRNDPRSLLNIEAEVLKDAS